MKFSKMEILLFVVALFVGIHFYTEYRLEKEIGTPAAAPAEGVAPMGTLLLDSEKKPVIVAFGDSMTAGVGANPGEDWPSQLSTMLGIEIINAGRAGESTASGVGRIGRVIDRYKPDIIMIEEGAYDLKNGRRHQTIASNLIKMVKIAMQKGVKPVLIGFPNVDLLDLMVTSDLDIYEKVAERTGVYYISDVFGPVLADEELKSDDFFHPNAKGYKEIAQRIYRHLMENPL